MFPWYGILGIVMMLYAEASLFFSYLKINPLYQWTFPIVWFGYIFFIDAFIYWKKKTSLIKSHPKKFFALLLISAPLWQVFEFINLFIQNWYYLGTDYFGRYGDIFGWISFSTVMPAFFETFDLVTFRDKKNKEGKRRISHRYLNLMIAFGILIFILSLSYPRYFFPYVWVSLFLILDPLNYKSLQPSILAHWEHKNKTMVLKMLASGIFLGFLWEFWNFWAPVKWIYSIPFVHFLKIFEMPLFGYLGYFPFALELYATYYFIEGLFLK